MVDGFGHFQSISPAVSKAGGDPDWDGAVQTTSWGADVPFPSAMPDRHALNFAEKVGLPPSGATLTASRALADELGHLP